MPGLLVGRVVAPGAVGRRDEDVGLTLVQRFAIEAEPDVADRHNPPFSPHHAHGCVGDLVAARRGRDDHRVGAEPFRPAFDGGLRLVGGDDELGSELGRQLATALDRLDSDDAAPGGAHHLHREEPEQAEPDDDHSLSERRLGTANTL